MSYLDDFFDNRKKIKRDGRTAAEIKSDEDRLLANQRDRILNYKKFFGDGAGKDVMLDLMNKFYILSPLPESSDPLALARAEGKREVVLYLLSRANMDMNQLDKILKGEFS